MAKGLKTNGLQEVGSFKKRVVRQYNLGRIGASDKNELISLINQIEARVIKMQESSKEGDLSLWV